MEKHQNNVFSLPQGPEYSNPPRRTAESETGNTSWKSWDELPLSFDVETLAFVMGCKIGKARPVVMGTISSYFSSRIETAEGVQPSPGLAISNDVSVFVPEITELNGFNKAVQ